MTTPVTSLHILAVFQSQVANLVYTFGFGPPAQFVQIQHLDSSINLDLCATYCSKYTILSTFTHCPTSSLLYSRCNGAPATPILTPWRAILDTLLHMPAAQHSVPLQIPTRIGRKSQTLPNGDVFRTGSLRYVELSFFLSPHS